MKKEKIKNNLMLVLLILFSVLFLHGCFNAGNGGVYPPSGNGSVLPPPSPTEGSLVIAGGDESTNDSTPLLTISSEGADYMSFSGDGEEWSEWLPYAVSCIDFNIASGEYGTEFSQGDKYVYVRFKNENGDLSPQDDLAGDDILIDLPT